MLLREPGGASHIGWQTALGPAAGDGGVPSQSARRSYRGVLGRYALLLELETRGGIVCELCTDLRSDGDAMFRAALPAVPLDRPALLLGFPFRGFPLRGFPLRVFPLRGLPLGGFPLAISLNGRCSYRL